jgi:transposase
MQFHKKEMTEMIITRVGIDLAKNVFQVHGVDDRGMPVLKKQLKHAQVLAYFVNLLPHVRSRWKPVTTRIVGKETLSNQGIGSS